jgi:hypothetical protein
MYIRIRNPQGGGADIYLFLGKKPGVRRNPSSNMGKVKDKDTNADLMTYEDVTPYTHIRR